MNSHSASGDVQTYQLYTSQIEHHRETVRQNTMQANICDVCLWHNAAVVWDLSYIQGNGRL